MIELAGKLNRYPDTAGYLCTAHTGLESLQSKSFQLIYSNIVLQHVLPDVAVSLSTSSFGCSNPMVSSCFNCHLTATLRLRPKSSRCRTARAPRRHRARCGAAGECRSPERAERRAQSAKCQRARMAAAPRRSPRGRQPLARCHRRVDVGPGRRTSTAVANCASRTRVAGTDDDPDTRGTGEVPSARSISCTRGSRGTDVAARRRSASQSM